MAKIYQTQQDVERDTLKEQSVGLSFKSFGQAANALLLWIAGDLANTFYRDKPQTRGWLNVASWAAFGLGIVQAVKAWVTSSKAHDLELQRERLGPETVIYPPDMPMAAPDKVCCPAKDHAAAIGQKTLLEHAQKTEIAPSLSQP